LRRALLDADVNFKIAKDFTARVKKSNWSRRFNDFATRQLLVMVKDELTELMGGDVAELTYKDTSVILMSGLQGSGKLFSGKLANIN
jgi:signal recognition particle subunit SRP54